MTASFCLCSLSVLSLCYGTHCTSFQLSVVFLPLPVWLQFMPICYLTSRFLEDTFRQPYKYIFHFLMFMGPCIFNLFLSTTKKIQRIQYSLLLSVLDMFRAVFPPIIKSSKNVHAVLDTFQTFHSPTLAVAALLKSIQCCMYSFWAPDDERKNLSKNVEHWRQ